MYPDIRKNTAAALIAAAVIAAPAYASDARGAGDTAAQGAPVTVSGAALPDPTRPLPLMRRAIEAGLRDGEQGPEIPDAGQQGPVLSAVMTSPVRGAVINGTFVKEGASSGGITLESVSGDSAALVMPDGRKITLRLFESSLKISR